MLATTDYMWEVIMIDTYPHHF